MKRRIASLFLVLALLISYVPVVSHAQEPQAELSNDALQVEGTNSFGALVSADIAQQQEEEAEDTGAYNVVGLTVEGNTATVEYGALGDATVIVGIYSEDSVQMLASGTAAVSPDESEATVTITGDMPQYFVATAYLVDNYDYSPLCTAYSTPMYTREMQELLASTVDDYDADRVLNLDEDKTTNFAVYAEDTLVVEQKNGKNTVASANDETLTYVIENADATFTGLQPGDVVAYEYGDGQLLIAKVDTISVSGSTVTIHGADLEAEEVFSHVKIETSGTTEDMTVDENSGDEGVTYTGLHSEAEAASLIRSNPGISSASNQADESFAMSFGFKIKKETDVGDIEGSLLASVKTDFEYYISLKRQFIELKVATNTKVALEVSGKSSIPLSKLKSMLKLKSIGFSPIPGVFIGFDPEVVLEFSASIEFSAELVTVNGFSYENKKGVKDLSEPARVDFGVEAKATIFLGIDMCPNVKIVGGAVLSVELSAMAGVELKAEIGGTDFENVTIVGNKALEESRHACKSCLECKVYLKVEVSLNLKFLNMKALTVSFNLTSKKINLGDFYFSLDTLKGGKGKCPNKAYRVTVQVYDESEDPAAGAQVNVQNNNYKPVKDMGETNRDGTVTTYLPAGTYWFIANVDGQDVVKRAKISKACKVALNAAAPEEPGVSFISGVVDEDAVTDNSAMTVVETGSCGEGVTYTLYGNGLLEIQGKGAIADGAFESNDSIKNVVIKDGVTNIGVCAFSACFDLSNITIPNSVTTIGDGAFDSCENLSSITIPQGVTSIGDATFAWCTNLESITIPGSVTSIGYMAFYRCESLHSITIPDSVKTIGDDAFGRCTNLENIVIPSGVTSIGVQTFYGCESLRSITIPQGVTSIGDMAFRGCESLHSITIPDSVKTIGDKAFAWCTNLENIVIPSGVTSIGFQTFYVCESLHSITIPDSVKTIGDEAFAWCTNLENIVIPSGVTSIGFQTFYVCESLRSITIPQGVTSIGDSAFFSCGNLIDGDVFYGGSQAQWNSIKIGSDNECLLYATIHYNSASGSTVDEVAVAVQVPEEVAQTGVDVSVENPKYKAVYGGEYSSEEKESYILKTASFQGLVPEEEYLLLSMASLEAENLLTAENLLYVGQGTAASDGTLSFTYVQRIPTDVAYVIACGASNRNLKDAAITFPEMQESDEPKTVNPTVVYDGAELVEGRDYELLGQVDYMEAGEYTCYIRGINNYTGLVECTYQVEAAIEKFNIAFANMTLGNSLAMNFAFRQDACEDWSGAYAKIVKTYADGRANKEITIPYAQWGSAGINGVAHFALKFDGVAAKEMSDSVFVTIYDGNATPSAIPGRTPSVATQCVP